MSAGPPQANATLTAVTSATAATGGREDWDEPEGAEPAGAGASKWTGSEPAYYLEKVERAPDGSDVYVRRTLVLQTATARAAGIDTDDVLTFTDPTGTTRQATAQLIRYSDAPISAQLQTTRIDLQPA